MSVKTSTKTEVIDSTIETPQTVCMLFDISNEVKEFYETPVIFIGKKDFSEKAFHLMSTVHGILDEGDKGEKTQALIVDLIVDYHMQWMQYVNDIEKFKNNDRHLSKEDINQAVHFTIECIGYRLKNYQRYVERRRSTLTNENHICANAELEIVEEMHKEVTRILADKLQCFRGIQSDDEFDIHVLSEIDDLLCWLDIISDNLSMLLSKYINLSVLNFSNGLTKTLQQIVQELQTNKSPPATELFENLKKKGNDISSMVRTTVNHDLEISKVEEAISALDDRIKFLEDENSPAAVGTLRSKKEYLEARLVALDNMKTTVKGIHALAEFSIPDIPSDELCICPDFFQMRIFNHALPASERERLVSDLCYLWDMAVHGKKGKSMISILSAADEKEEFTDEIGVYYVDEYNRKIYKRKDLDECRCLGDDVSLYQCDENGTLVPLSDDSKHIYFYDECGRYFRDPNTRQKIYNARASTSEYLMDNSGVLIKLKEVRNGITYYYDSYGRYYINNEGKHIYQDEDAISEYENDGFGNLVRIKSHSVMLEPCPADENVTEDFKYLKQNIGAALRACIAETIIQQPADPVKCLSMCLIKYRENIEQREKRAREKELLDAERKIRADEEREAMERAAREDAMLLAHGGSEASYDSNLIKYKYALPSDITSASSKD